MDGIANVAKQQQSQLGSAEVQGKAPEQSQRVQQNSQIKTEQSPIEEMQDSLRNDTKKIDSQKDVEDLAQKLNDALAPLATNIKFGVDKDNIFYVAAIDTKTNTIIRRYPAEQARDFLPKMQEVSGILFDSKG